MTDDYDPLRECEREVYRLEARVAELNEEVTYNATHWKVEVQALKQERDAIAAALAAIKNQEPVAWMEWAEQSGAWFLAYSYNPEVTTRPLYAKPTPPVREPLSDDQCRDIYNAAMELTNRSAVSVMRYIESKIKEQK